MSAIYKLFYSKDSFNSQVISQSICS